MKRSTTIQRGRVALVALGLLVSAFAVEPAFARQSERARERTRTTRVERQPAQKNVPKVTRTTGRTPQEARSTSKAPARNERTQAAQRAPSRNERTQAAQRAPSRNERTQAAQRAPSRDQRNGDVRQDQTRTGRPGAGAVRNGAEGRTSRVIGSRNGSVVPGTRSTLRRDRLRSAVRDRTRVLPRYRYRPYVNVWSRPIIRARWPLIHVHLDWPWLVRYERRWAPRYRYRQVIRVEVVHDGRRDWSDVEVETFYRHSVRRATADWAEIDIEIDQIDVYDGDRYLGYVANLPQELRTIRATVYRSGEIRFDREVFLVGDPRVGFEVISTRHYDGWVQDSYRPEDGYRAGRVDLRRHRVLPIRRSRLWDPYRYTGVVPVSLLPDQQGWLWDYGVEALSAVYDDYDWYYGGAGTMAPRGASEDPGLVGADEWSYQTRDGADIRYERESSLDRVR